MLRLFPTSRSVVPLAALAMLASACSTGRTDPAMAPGPDGVAAATGASSIPVEYLLTELGPTAIPTSGSEPSIRFDDVTRRVTGFSGCNRFNGSFTRSGESVKFGTLAMTRMACSDAALTQLELRFTQALGQATSMVQSGENSIELKDPNGTVLARLRRR